MSKGVSDGKRMSRVLPKRVFLTDTGTAAVDVVEDIVVYQVAVVRARGGVYWFFGVCGRELELMEG